MKKVLGILLALGILFSLFGTAAVAEEPVKSATQVYKEGMLLSAEGQASFITTTAHRLDASVNQVGVALAWNGELKNLLVENYEMEEDGKVWILHIRPEAKWHDGEDVVAEDFIWSYSAWANPRIATRWNSKASSILGYDEVQAGDTDTLAGVTKVDDKTVRVELKQAMPLWMKIEQIYLVIHPYHVFADVKPEDVIAHPYWTARIGTGPFVWTEYQPGQYIMLTKNANYYDGEPILETVYYVFFQDAAAMLNAYASGEIDTTFYEANGITPQERDYYASLPNRRLVTMDKGSCSAITLNCEDEDWSKPEIRQALLYAIDKQALLDNLYPGAINAITLFPQRWTWTDKLNDYAYNPDLAKELLEKNGYSGKTHLLTYVQSDTLTQSLLVALQQYWAAVGVNVELSLIDAAATTAMNQENRVDMALAGTGMAVDPSLGETLITTGQMLSANYSNARVDELFTLGKSFSSQEDRVPVYQEIAEILNAEAARAFLWYDIRDLGFSTKVIGPYEHFAEQHTIYFNLGVYNEMEKWYVTD